MDLTIKHCALYLIILGIINKELRLHAHIVQGKKFYMVFTKGQFLRQLLSNADICDIFIAPSHYDIANYGDDNTQYISGRNIEEELDL